MLWEENQMAIAILGWPIDKLAPEVAAQVMEGVERPALMQNNNCRWS
jgi:selenophosphate synthase